MDDGDDFTVIKHNQPFNELNYPRLRPLGSVRYTELYCLSRSVLLFLLFHQVVPMAHFPLEGVLLQMSSL